MSNVYERETDEFQPIVVIVDGVTLTTTTNLSFSITDLATRPSVWLAAETYGGSVGLWITDMATPGTYQVWWKYISGSETIIRRSGQLVIR